MVITKAPRAKTELEIAISTLLDRMSTTPEESPEYAQMADQLVKLYKLKEHDSPKRVSPDTLVLVAGNLAGILLIIGYERAHVVTSKALSFVGKLR